jgi:hypothetical protein
MRVPVWLIGRPSVPFPPAFDSLAFERPRAEGPQQVPVGAPIKMGVHVATVAMRERSGHHVSIAPWLRQDRERERGEGGGGDAQRPGNAGPQARQTLPRLR